MAEVAQVMPKDIPGLWDMFGPTGEQFFDITTNQVMYIARDRGWLLPEPSLAERADLMREAGHRPEDFC